MIKHSFVQCLDSRRSSVAVLEMDLNTEQVVRTWNITGKPYGSPDGRFILVLHLSVNRTANVLLDSKVHVLFISGGSSTPVLKSTLDISFGVSRLVFGKKFGQEGGYPVLKPTLHIPSVVSEQVYDKVGQGDSYVAYISLLYSDKIAVLDLDQLASGNAAAVSYIEGVGSEITAPRMHAVSRPLALSGRWLVSPANANNSVVIIDTSTRKIHGMVMGVIGGQGLIATPAAAAQGTYRFKETLVIALMSALFKSII